MLLKKFQERMAVQGKLPLPGEPEQVDAIASSGSRERIRGRCQAFLAPPSGGWAFGNAGSLEVDRSIMWGYSSWMDAQGWVAKHLVNIQHIALTPISGQVG